jgi:hypothetical protein
MTRLCHALLCALARVMVAARLFERVPETEARGKRWCVVIGGDYICTRWP